MATEPPSFAAHLDRVSSSLVRGDENKRDIHWIVGNPAGDADSIVSALALSYVLDDDHPLGAVAAEQKQATASKIPLMPIARSDIVLRRETTLLMEIVGIQSENLLYMDDVESIDKNHDAQGDVVVTLVDHNHLVHPPLLQHRVVEILDHHVDEGHHEDVQGERRVIAFEKGQATVASTCTLVAEVAKDRKNLPPDVAFCLVAVILLDSGNMSPQVGKGTPRDQAALDWLLSGTDWKSVIAADHGSIHSFVLEDGTLDTTCLFTTLQESKFDKTFWKSLSVRDALRLDAKNFVTRDDAIPFGASSVLLSMEEFTAKPGMARAVHEYMKERGVVLWLVLCMVFSEEEGTPQRNILVCGSQADTARSVAQFLTQDATLKASKVQEQTEGELTWIHLSQGNPKASRKQVVPILFRYFEQAEQST